MSVGTNGLVLLEATIGLQNNTPSASNLIFTIVRNAVQIFTARSSPWTVDSYEAVHLSFTDSGIPAGYYGYALVVSAIGTGNPPVIIGPLVFSGISVS